MADETANLTLAVLKQIRDEAYKTNERLERIEGRLERTELGLSDLGRFMREIALDQARHERFHHTHVDQLDTRVRDLDERVTKLEGGTRTP
jgi:hypothetical protein